MRKQRTSLEIFIDVPGFMAVARRLDINKHAICDFIAVDGRISDPADGTAASLQVLRLAIAARVDTNVIELDRDSEIDPNFPNGFAEIRERAFRILPSIAYHDVVAATQHHFLKSQ